MVSGTTGTWALETRVWRSSQWWLSGPHLTLVVSLPDHCSGTGGGLQISLAPPFASLRPGVRQIRPSQVISLCTTEEAREHPLVWVRRVSFNTRGGDVIGAPAPLWHRHPGRRLGSGCWTHSLPLCQVQALLKSRIYLAEDISVPCS